MRIVYYPDPVLQQRAQPVDLAREGLREFVEEMIHTMKEAAGVGLAGPQVGEPMRLFVASETGEIDDAIAFINPEIRPFGSPQPFEEGCLSLPGLNGEVTRPESVEVTWTDLDGERHTAEFTSLMARIIQHEFDHLEGVLFFQRMTPADRIRIRADLEAFEADYRERNRTS
ncbi:MAG: peptide deformylase [Planctomycetota bacterium]|jgi:peptide deformylase